MLQVSETANASMSQMGNSTRAQVWLEMANHQRDGDGSSPRVESCQHRVLHRDIFSSKDPDPREPGATSQPTVASFPAADRSQCR